MLLRPLRYARPESLEEAITLLAASPESRPLAGGQSLLNVLKHRAADVDALVDVSRLEELREIRAGADGGLEIGAAVTYASLEGDAGVRAAQPKIAEVAAGLVDQQVRCRGTIGGNACFNDPGSNFPPLLVALGATMRVRGPDGDREVAAADFFLGTYRVDLGPGELLREIAIPPAEGAGIGYSSLQLARDSWAVGRAAVRLRCGETIAEPLVVLGCIAGRPVRAAAVEQALAGTEPTEAAIAAAAQHADQGIDPIGDVHAGPEYRRQMARVVVKRAVTEAVEKARRNDG